MPAVELLTPAPSSTSQCTDPLPPVLQTPSGLAIIEIQGTLQGSFQTEIQNDAVGGSSEMTTTYPIGRLEFPLYDPQAPKDDTKWMKKVYLYVGKYQRLTGEAKKLAKPLAVVRKVGGNTGDDGAADRDATTDGKEELEVVEIVKFKILFSGRPEPVGE
jgi:hypothetical protein